MNPAPSACSVVEHALAEEIDLGAAVHLALEQFEAIDLTFNLPLTPVIAQGRAHSGLVPAQATREANEF